MPKKMEAWGVPYDESIVRSPTWDCPQCPWVYGMAPYSVEEKAKTIVGYSPDEPELSENPSVTGIFIVQCPKDGARFWFHVIHDRARLAQFRTLVLAAHQE